MLVSTDRAIYNMLQEAEDLCSSGALELHFMNEVSMQPTGLIFRKHSNYSKAFSVVVAESIEEYIRALHQ